MRKQPDSTSIKGPKKDRPYKNLLWCFNSIAPDSYLWGIYFLWCGPITSLINANSFNKGCHLINSSKADWIIRHTEAFSFYR